MGGYTPRRNPCYWRSSCKSGWGKSSEERREKKEDTNDDDLKNLGEFVGSIFSALGGFASQPQQNFAKQQSKKHQGDEKMEEDGKEKAETKNHKAESERNEEIPSFMKNWFNMFNANGSGKKKLFKLKPNIYIRSGFLNT